MPHPFGFVLCERVGHFEFHVQSKSRPCFHDRLCFRLFNAAVFAHAADGMVSAAARCHTRAAQKLEDCRWRLRHPLAGPRRRRQHRRLVARRACTKSPRSHEVIAVRRQKSPPSKNASVGHPAEDSSDRAPSSGLYLRNGRGGLSFMALDVCRSCGLKQFHPSTGKCYVCKVEVRKGGTLFRVPEGYYADRNGNIYW